MGLLVHLHLDKKDTEDTALCSGPQGEVCLLRMQQATGWGAPSQPQPPSASVPFLPREDSRVLRSSLSEWQCPWREPNLRAKSPRLLLPPPPSGSGCRPAFPFWDLAFPCCEFMCQRALPGAAHSLPSDQHTDLTSGNLATTPKHPAPVYPELG